MKLSIVIPVYNEEATLSQVIERIERAEFQSGVEKEIIVVDDCSTDSSAEIIRSLDKDVVVAAFHEKNQGKGAALHTGFKLATGDIVIVQDADLEYNPDEHIKVIQPILDGKADVVFGSRFLSADTHKVVHFWHMLGNKALTFLSNVFTDLYLTDMETCYKAFRREVIQKVELEEKRFGFEPEVTAKIAAMAKREGLRIYEVGITYKSRTFSEGKKIGMKDAFRTLWCIVKYNESMLAKAVKYVLMGVLVALSQLLTMVFLVEVLGFESVKLQNIAYAVSIETSIICGFLLHSFFTWRYRFKSVGDFIGKLAKFNLITGISFAVRQALFYGLLLVGVGYIANTFIGIAVAIALNFAGYEKLVFKRK